MDKVSSCVAEIPSLLKAFIEGDASAIETIAALISKLEHEADLTKNDIRNHLPRSLFLPLDRGALLEILSLQDALADQAEAIGMHTAIAPFQLPEEMKEIFSLFCQKNMEIFWLVRQVIKELEELLECSFGGIEAEKVKGMVEQIAYLEYETTQMKRNLLKILYTQEKELTYPEFHLSLTLIEKIGDMARICEKLGNRIQMLLELH